MLLCLVCRGKLTHSFPSGMSFIILMFLYVNEKSPDMEKQMQAEYPLGSVV